MPGRRKKLLIALLSVPVAVIAGELVARAFLAISGSAYSAAETREALLDARSAVVDKIPDMDDRERAERGEVVMHPHPYAGWDVLSDQIAREAKSYAEGQYEKGFEVLILGGSVSALTASKGRQAMGQVLRRDPRLANRQLTLFNHGRGSFKQPQMTQKAAYLLTMGYRPDAIVLIDGFNEVALGNDNATLGAHPVYPHWVKYGPMIEGTGINVPRIRNLSAALAVRDAMAREVDRAIAWHFDKSAILGRWARKRADTRREQWFALQNAIVRGTGGEGQGFLPERGGPYPRDTEQVLDLIADAWVDASIQLNALCEAYDITFLHVLQPTLHDEGMKPLHEKELTIGDAQDSWIEGAKRGYPKLRAASARIRAAGVPFLDGSDTFLEFEKPTYYDVCHFRGEGMDLFAARIGEALLAALP